MTRVGVDTRTRIMDTAEDLILGRGFAATSIESIVAGAGVTKGAFFHHFSSKAELAHALVERYARLDAEQLEETMARAERLARDPLRQLLLFVALLEEAWRERKEPFPGCLFASYLYEAGLFDDETHAVIRHAMARWRDGLGAKVREVMESHAPRFDVDAEELADMITVIFEGAFVVSRTMAEAELVAAQLRHYRNYLELLFSPGTAAA